MVKLFDKLCDKETLWVAWQRVLGKNACGGIDGIRPKDIEVDIHEMISSLGNDLRTQKYAPVPYAKMAIPKFNDANELRNLSMPSVKDKIVQQAFVNVVGPLFEKEFLDCSYAYRKDKGPVRAIKRVEHILECHPVQWVATLDIDNFFDSMNHNVLLNEIMTKVDEAEVLSLVKLWLHAGTISGKGDWDDPDEGIAQGAIVSPILSNVYLHSLDKFSVVNGYYYVRYSDNFIVLAENKDAIYVAYEQIKGFIEDRLKLSLNENPYPFKDVNGGFAFLGIYFRGSTRQISTNKETKIFRKINWATEKTYQKNIDEFLKKLNEMVEGVKRYYSFVKPMKQFEAFDQHLIKRLRFLFIGFCTQGIFSSEKELYNFTQKILFFADRSADVRDVFCHSFAGEIYKAFRNRGNQGKDPKTVSEKSSQTYRATAQKNRYLRIVGSHSEVVVSTPGVFIGKTGGRIVLRQQRQNVLEIPFSKVRNLSINTEGVTFSSDIVLQCSRSKIPISFYSHKGMPYAVLQSPLHSMGTISVMQIKTYETERALDLVKNIMIGKSKNQMNLIKFYLRHRKDTNPDFREKATINLEQMKKYTNMFRKIVFSKTYSIILDQVIHEGRPAVSIHI